ncbi:MAG: HAMP domain-containing sensor histidine kinase, partial [Eubacteriales bacterium]|nr:HAMP domain-containing sensor histidine kinase [Eubacteriales bacterium]
ALTEGSHSEFLRTVPEAEYRELLQACNQLLRQSLRQAEELAANQAAVQQTISNLAHDLRTPLTGAKGYLELLIEAQQDSTIERLEQEEILALIQQRLEILNELLEQLFTYTKSRDESLKLEAELFELNEFIRQIFALAYADFEQAGITLELDLNPEPIRLAEDRQALQQIFSNLIQNVLRYAKSQFYLRTRLLEDSILISCSNDLREAIDPSLTAELHERYKRGAKHRPEGASGLGLAIVSSYLERMGASLSITTTEEQFCLEIRLRK